MNAFRPAHFAGSPSRRATWWATSSRVHNRRRPEPEVSGERDDRPKPTGSAWLTFLSEHAGWSAAEAGGGMAERGHHGQAEATGRIVRRGRGRGPAYVDGNRLDRGVRGPATVPRGVPDLSRWASAPGAPVPPEAPCGAVPPGLARLGGRPGFRSPLSRPAHRLASARRGQAARRPDGAGDVPAARP